MKKFTGFEGYDCVSCMGNGGCNEWIGSSIKCNGKYYANKEEVMMMLSQYNIFKTPPRLKFIPGDNVFSTVYGNGCVIEINPDLHYPVKVRFESDVIMSYLYNGKFNEIDAFRSLFFGHYLKLSIEEIIPKRALIKTVWIVMNYDTETNKISYSEFIQKNQADANYTDTKYKGSLPPFKMDLNITNIDHMGTILYHLLTRK